MLDRYSTHQTLPFEKLSPTDFERLSYWLIEANKFENIYHLGGANDNGQDIVAELNNKTHAFQCKRTKTFSFTHAEKEIKKILTNVHPKPDFLIFITNAKVSINTIEKSQKLWGDKSCQFWSGIELDY